VTPESINVDLVAAPLEWARAAGQLAQLQPAGGSRGPTCWLSTIDAKGAPHTAGVVGHWLDDILFLSAGREPARAAKVGGGFGISAFVLEVDPELAQLDDRRSSPADRVR
jgi:hypothetical protein